MGKYQKKLMNWVWKGTALELKIVGIGVFLFGIALHFGWLGEALDFSYTFWFIIGGPVAFGIGYWMGK